MSLGILETSKFIITSTSSLFSDEPALHTISYAAATGTFKLVTILCGGCQLKFFFLFDSCHRGDFVIPFVQVTLCDTLDLLFHRGDETSEILTDVNTFLLDAEALFND